MRIKDHDTRWECRTACQSVVNAFLDVGARREKVMCLPPRYNCINRGAPCHAELHSWGNGIYHYSGRGKPWNRGSEGCEALWTTSWCTWHRWARHPRVAQATALLNNFADLVSS